jgi:hypothetical protein
MNVTKISFDYEQVTDRGNLIGVLSFMLKEKPEYITRGNVYYEIGDYVITKTGYLYAPETLTEAELKTLLLKLRQRGFVGTVEK